MRSCTKHTIVETLLAVGEFQHNLKINVDVLIILLHRKWIVGSVVCQVVKQTGCCYQESVPCNVCLLRELKLRSWLAPAITGDLFELQKLSGGLELNAETRYDLTKFYCWYKSCLDGTDALCMVASFLLGILSVLLDVDSRHENPEGAASVILKFYSFCQSCSRGTGAWDIKRDFLLVHFLLICCSILRKLFCSNRIFDA